MTDEQILEVCRQVKELASGSVPGKVIEILQGPVLGFSVEIATALERYDLARRIILMILERQRRGDDFRLTDLFGFSEQVRQEQGTIGPCPECGVEGVHSDSCSRSWK